MGIITRIKDLKNVNEIETFINDHMGTICIDRSMCRLPEGYSLYKVTGTYGREFSAFVSAKTPKDAKKIFRSVYDYMNPKILNTEPVDTDQTAVYDRSKFMILGNVDIITQVKTGDDIIADIIEDIEEER